MPPEHSPDGGVTWSMSRNKLNLPWPNEFTFQILLSVHVTRTLKRTRRSLSRLIVIKSDLKVDRFHLDRVDLNGSRVQTAGPSVWGQICELLRLLCRVDISRSQIAKLQ